MKKNQLLLLVFGVLLVGIFLYFSFRDSVPDAPEIIPGESKENEAETSDDETSEKIGKEAEAEIPEISSEDIRMNITSPSEYSEEKFLTEKQKKELKKPSLTKGIPIKDDDQTFMVSWKKEMNESLAKTAHSALPDSLPIYVIDRKTDRSVFGYLIDFAEKLGLSGAIARRNPSTYILAESDGDSPLEFNLYDSTFRATGLNLPVSEKEGITGVQETLENLGIINFPVKGEVYKSRYEDTRWFHFIPQLSLPILTLENIMYFEEVLDDNGNSIDIGLRGFVDVEYDEGKNTIVSMFRYFPNVREDSAASTTSSDDFLESIQKGEFQNGSIHLKFPGALPLADRSKFYTLSHEDKVSISDASLDAVDCGYLFDNTRKVRHFIAPACLVTGSGFAFSDYAVEFTGVVSIVE